MTSTDTHEARDPRAQTVPVHEAPEPTTVENITAVPAGLEWAEGIAHRRLLALSATAAAAQKLRSHETLEHQPAAVPPFLKHHLWWGTNEEKRTLEAWVADTLEHRAPGSTNDLGWRRHRTSRSAEEAAMRRHTLGLEHRRVSWQTWDPKEPDLRTDQVRILLAPLATEELAEAAVAVDIRARPHLNGRIAAATTQIWWTTNDQSGQYPRPPAEETTLRPRPAVDTATIEALIEAAHWLTRFYNVSSMIPTDTVKT